MAEFSTKIGFLAATLAVSLGAGPVHAAKGLVLISPDEAKAEAAAESSGQAPAMMTKAFDPMGPSIAVLTPRIDQPSRPPFNVRVEIKPKGNWAIDRGSLKVRYGFLGVDVTERMLQSGSWQGNAFVVSGALAPAGTHKFNVSIKDSAGHVGQAEMKVIILP